MKGKGYAKGRSGRLIIALLLSIMMTVTFVPTSAFAGTADQTDDGTQAEQNVDLQSDDGQKQEQEEVVAEPAAEEGDVVIEEAAGKGAGETPDVDGVVNAKNGDGDLDLEDPESIVLNEIEFGTGIGLGLSQAWTVNGKTGTISQVDMGITVIDENGDPVDSENYSLWFARTYYDEQQHQDVYDYVEPPLGIHSADQEEGFTEYVVYATAEDESGYSGCTKYASIFIVDKYSLNYIGAEKEFKNYIKHDNWRMAERYWVSLEGLADGTGVTTLAGTKLTEDSDYTVTYYERTVEPTDDPDVDREDVLTPAGEPLDGIPATDGGYLAVFEAADESNYYGGDVVLLDVGDYSEMYLYSGPVFDEEDDVVYDDGTLTYTLETVGIPDDAVINYSIIRGNGNQLPTGCCTISEDNRTITLNGKALVNNEVKWVLLRAEAKVNGKVICTTYDEDDDDDWVVCKVAKSFVDYDYEDCDLLPGDEYWVDKDNTMFIKDTAHPFGERIDYTATSVKVTKGAQFIEEQYLEVKNGVTYIKKESKGENPDDFWYRFQAKDNDELGGGELGDIELTVAYELKKGNHEPQGAQAGNFGFTVSVKNDVYDLDISSDNDNYDGLPGDEFDLTASACHSYYDDRGEYKEDAEGLTYQWYYAIGSDLSEEEPCDDEWTMIPAGGLTNHDIIGFTIGQTGEPTGHLTFKALPEDQDSEEIYVRVAVLDGDEIVADDWTTFYMNDEYFAILPYQIGNLDLGESKTINAEVLSRCVGEDDEVLDDVQFYWEYDDEVVSITDANGQKVGNFDDNGKYITSEASVGNIVPFTITRIGSDDCNIGLYAEWDEGSEEGECHYWVDRIETDLSDYRVNFKNSTDGWRLFGDYTNGQTVIAADELDDEIEVVCGDFVLDPKHYNLKIQYENWIGEGETEYVDATELVYHGANNSTYRVVAQAKQDSPYEGETRETYIDLYNASSLAGAEVSFPGHEAPRTLAPMVDYYWFTVGESASPTVKINGGEPLTLGTDFAVSYIDEDNNILNAFPETSGSYICKIIPAEGSSYVDEYDRTIITVMTEEDMDAAEVAIAEGGPVFNKIERFFDENCTDAYKQKVRAEYDALSDEAKAWTPDYLKRVLHDDTGCFWDEGVVTTEATCAVDGEKHFTCTYEYCDETKDEVIPATGHSWSTITTDQAGYMHNGGTCEWCSNCGTTRNAAVVPGWATSFVKGMKAAKGKGAITVKWKKQKKNNLKKFNGYQIQVATDSGFTNIVKSANAGKKSKSKKFKGLQKKTQYYVRMRSYTKSGGEIYYSPWTIKGVKTK